MPGKGFGLAGGQPHFSAGQQNGGAQPHNISAERAKTGLVKIIHIKIIEAVVGTINTEIFNMQVAANPALGRGGQAILRRMAIKQMGRGAKKRKR